MTGMNRIRLVAALRLPPLKNPKNPNKLRLHAALLRPVRQRQLRKKPKNRPQRLVARLRPLVALRPQPPLKLKNLNQTAQNLSRNLKRLTRPRAVPPQHPAGLGVWSQPLVALLRLPLKRLPALRKVKLKTKTHCRKMTVTRLLLRRAGQIPAHWRKTTHRRQWCARVGP